MMNELRKSIFLLLLLCCPIAATCALTYKGQVIDKSSHEAVAFANIVAFRSDNDAFIVGTVSDADGIFTLTVDETTPVYLRINSMGYEPLRLSSPGSNLGVIELTPQTYQLDEVVVKSSQPKTVLRGEGMTTTVAGSVLEKSASMNHLLDVIPNVSANNGNIEVFGRGTPEIYINGRKMTDRTELERIRPDEVRNIEVITNPGARYGATVKSVIRITTKRPVGEGFGLDTRTSVSVDEKEDMSLTESLRLNYRKGKWDMNAHLYGESERMNESKRLRQMTFLEQTWQVTNDIENLYKSVNPYVRLASSCQFSQDHSAGASVSYDRYISTDVVGHMNSFTLRDGMFEDRSHSMVGYPALKTNVSANMYYVGKVGKVGIDFNADYYWSGKKEEINTEESFAKIGAAPVVFRVNAGRRSYNMLLASKLVLTVPLLSGNMSLGGELSSSSRKGFYDIVPADVAGSERSRFKEKMTSLFADYGRSFGKLDVRAGLRYEYIDFDYFDHGVYQSDRSRTYGNWLPSVSLSMPVGKTQMQLSYGTDIDRPSYMMLRNGVQYYNQYTYETGNPFLMTSLTRNLSYTMSWKWLSFNTMFSHVRDEIQLMVSTYKENPTVVLAHPENLPSYNKLTASLSLSPRFGIWQPSFRVMLYKQWFEMETHDGNNLGHPVATFRFNNTFDTKWATASLNMTARTKGYQGNEFYNRGWFGTDLSLHKSLLNDRLVLQLYVRDIFGTGDESCITYSGKEQSAYREEYSMSTVTFTVRYLLNPSRSKYKGTGAGESQRRRM
ncbi:MAG: outer membrane beta-barrel protein [Prevotellaceae bacterium]|nr:outer membrane beta-barrel protein [Prevotellaceae bacterium]